MFASIATHLRHDAVDLGQDAGSEGFPRACPTPPVALAAHVDPPAHRSRLELLGCEKAAFILRMSILPFSEHSVREQPEHLQKSSPASPHRTPSLRQVALAAHVDPPAHRSRLELLGCEKAAFILRMSILPFSEHSVREQPEHLQLRRVQGGKAGELSRGLNCPKLATGRNPTQILSLLLCNRIPRLSLNSLGVLN